MQCIILRQKVGNDNTYTLKLERPDEGRSVQQVCGVWCGMVWHEVVWCSMVRYGKVCVVFVDV